MVHLTTIIQIQITNQLYPCWFEIQEDGLAEVLHRQVFPFNMKYICKFKGLRK